MASEEALKADKQLSELLDRVEQGEEITITRQGPLVARLVPASDARQAASVEAFQRIRRRAKTLSDTFSPPVTIDEILEWKNEGRR